MYSLRDCAFCDVSLIFRRLSSQYLILDHDDNSIFLISRQDLLRLTIVVIVISGVCLTVHRENIMTEQEEGKEEQPRPRPASGGSGDGGDLFQQIMKDAWKDLTWPERCSLVVFTIPLFALYVICYYIQEKLVDPYILKKPPKKSHSELIQVASDIFQLPYCVPNPGCNATIVRDPNSGQLMIVSAPPCTDAAVEYCEELGTVKVLVVPSPAHDAHAKAWKARFPNSVVLTHPNAVADVSKVVNVDGTYSDGVGMPLLEQFKVVDFVDVSPYQRFPDAHLVISAPKPIGEKDTRLVVLGSCGFMGGPSPAIGSTIPYFLACVSGLGPRRYTRHGCLLWVKDCGGIQRQWLQLVNRPNVEWLIFQHGGGMPAAAVADGPPGQNNDARWLVTRYPFQNTF